MGPKSTYGTTTDLAVASGPFGIDMRAGRSYLMTRTEMMLSCYDYSKVIIQLYSVQRIIAHALHLRNVRSAKEVWNNNALITHNAVVMTPS